MRKREKEIEREWKKERARKRWKEIEEERKREKDSYRF